MFDSIDYQFKDIMISHLSNVIDASKSGNMWLIGFFYYYYYSWGALWIFRASFYHENYT